MNNPAPIITLGAIVGANLARLMEKRGLSAADLAASSPVKVGNQEDHGSVRSRPLAPPNEKTIRRILAGEIATPRQGTLQALAALLGVPVEQLTAPRAPVAELNGEELASLFPDIPWEGLDDDLPEAFRVSPVEKVPLTRIGRIRDLETFFRGDYPSVRKVYSLDLSDEDEDWAAELVDLVVRTSCQFRDRWYHDSCFGEVAKRSLLKEVFAKLTERTDLHVALGSTHHHAPDEDGNPQLSRLLFLGVSPMAKPMTSCLFNSLGED